MDDVSMPADTMEAITLVFLLASLSSEKSYLQLTSSTDPTVANRVLPFARVGDAVTPEM
jgi:hypothetical protein